jgi:hypothetical protein
MMGRSLHVLLLLAALPVAGSSCLLSPQPDPPGLDIVASATDQPGPVAVVGEGGTVPAQAGVRVNDASSDSFASGAAGEDGTFVVLLPRALPGDVLRVTYEEWQDGQWVESAPRNVVVDQYDPPLEPTADDRSTSPFAPGEYDAGVGVDAALYVDPPVDGQARVWCYDGCLQPGIRVIVANQNNAQVVESVHTGGPFEVRIPASIGDVLLIFSVRTLDESQASRVVRVVVPAP